MNLGKKVRFTSVVLAAAAVLTLPMAGCSKQPEKPRETPKTASSEAPKLDFVKLRLFAPTGGGMWKDTEEVQTALNKYLKEKNLNCELELVYSDWGTYNQKMPLILQSGEQVDLYWLNDQTFYNNVAKDAFNPLDELLEKHGKGIKDNVPQTLLDGGMVNGKLFAIPVNKEIASSTCRLFKKDLVEKYKFDLSKVKSWEDLEPIFETIKKYEPNITPLFSGNTDKPGEFETKYSLEHKGETSGVPGLTFLMINNKTGKVINKYESQGTIEKLKLMNKFYKAGYINQDAATTKTKPSDAIRAGKTWNISGSGVPGTEKARGTEFGMEFVRIETSDPIVTNSSITGSLNAIPRSSKDPARMMMILNLFYSDKYFYNLFIFGIENKNYIKVSDGIIKMPAGAKTDNDRGYSVGAWQFGNQFLSYLWDNEDPKKWEQYKEYNKKAKVSELFGLRIDQEPIKTEVAAVTNVVKEYDMMLETGTVDPDQVVKILTDKMKANGLDKIIAETQRQYDEWKKNKK